MTQRSTRVIYSMLSGFPLGIALHFIIGERFIVTLLLVIALIGALFFVRTRAPLMLLVSVFLLSSALGAARADIADVARSVSRESVVARDVYILDVVSDPVLTQFNQRFEARFDETKRARVLVRAPFYPRLSYGDRVAITGELKIPEDFETKNGRLFPYKTFLEKDYIFYTIYPHELVVLSQGGGNWLVAKLIAFKNSLTENLDQVVGKPTSSLLSGVTLGAEEGLGERLEDAFRKTGVVHILVLSGYNVTLVAEGITRAALTVLPRTAAIASGLVGIVLFALMTGATATVVRASLMASIALLGRVAYRAYDAGHALFVAGFFMLFHNPYILLYDPSFQLSFLATLGIICVAPLIEQRLKFIRFNGLKILVAATIGTQLAVLPLLVFMSGEISLISLAANIAIVPVVPVLMLMGSVTALVAFVSPTIAMPFAYAGELIATYVFKLVQLFSGIPFASLGTPAISGAVVVLIYIIAIAGFMKIKKPSVSRHTDQEPYTSSSS